MVRFHCQAQFNLDRKLNPIWSFEKMGDDEYEYYESRYNIPTYLLILIATIAFYFQAVVTEEVKKHISCFR